MSATKEERDLLVRLQTERAEKVLVEADTMSMQGFWSMAANRYYYAAYHLVQALLIKNGLHCHTHSGLIGMFSLHFVKTGLVKIETGGFLSRLEQIREKADYNCYYDVNEDEIMDIKPRTHLFFDELKPLLACSTCL